MQLTVAHDFLPKSRSTRTSIVMDHFGIDFETGRHVIAENLTLPINRGDVVLFTGASGSGKSSLMQAVAEKLSTRRPDLSTFDLQRSTLVNINDLHLSEHILIDALSLPIDESLPLLAACGLGEAQLMLRTPQELSDGQRYRFRLALGLSQKPQWLLADEFTATLDRTLARIIARNVRRLADRSATGCLLATTHEDIAEDLAPDIHVQCRLDGEVRVVTSRDEEAAEVDGPGSLKKKDRSVSSTNSGSQQRPKPIGRTSLGGITAVTRLDSHGL